MTSRATTTFLGDPLMRSLIVALLAITSASAPATAQCSDAEKAALQTLDRSWADATTRGDRAFLQSTLADDYHATNLIAGVGKTQTIDDAVRAAERTRTNPQPAPRVSGDNFVITCTPNTAVVTHRNVIVATADGKEQTTYSRSVHVLEKRAGRWQFVGSTGHALNDAAHLLYMENDWNNAFMKRDVAWFERHYADDMTEVSLRNGALHGKSDAIKAVRDDKSVFESVALSEMNVRMDGNTAVVTGVNRVRGRDDKGKPMDMRFRFTDTFVKRDGRWLVWATQATPISEQ